MYCIEEIIGTQLWLSGKHNKYHNYLREQCLRLISTIHPKTVIESIMLCCWFASNCCVEGRVLINMIYGIVHVGDITNIQIENYRKCFVVYRQTIIL